MNTLEKVRKGIDYLVEQSENKLNALGSVEKGKFVPTDPVVYKKYKSQIEFRLRFLSSVEELMIDYVGLKNILEEIYPLLKDKKQVDLNILEEIIHFLNK